ncbi:MAG: carboxypeptidase-like regulatory domain-containing protein [Planctomycetes bacterium]|nr:carboxypeptidase-like regulatory domain-containing protein [Planctomycetota bacterium]
MSLRAAWSVVLLGALAAGCGDAAGASARTTPVAGAAYLEAEPLVGVRLQFEADGALVEAVTDPAGGFEVRLPRGLWTITAPDLPDASALAGLAYGVDDLGGGLADREEDAWAAAVGGARVRVGDVRADADLAEAAPGDTGPLVVRFLRPHVLEGEVVDGDTGAPIGGARVRLVQPPEVEEDGEVTVTEAAVDAAGAFRLPVPGHARAGEWLVRASAAGYADGALFVLPEGAELTAPGREQVRVALRRPLALEGRVLDLAGRPLPATVRVAYSPPDARGTAERVWRTTTHVVRCGPDGRFRVDGVPRGAAVHGAGAGPHAALVQVVADLEGHEAASRTALVSRTSSPVTLELARLVERRGRVVTAEGAPVAGAHVGLSSCARAADAASPWSPCAEHLSDAQGWFLARGVPEREGWLHVSAPGFATGSAWLGREDAPVVVVLERPRPAAPTAPAAATPARRPDVECTVVTARPGASAALRVVREGDGGETHSVWLAGGQTTHLALSPGRYRLHALAAGHAPLTREVHVVDGEDQRLTLAMTPGGARLGLRVRWPEVPIAGFEVALVDPATGLERHVWLDAPGHPGSSLEVEGLGAGDARVEVRLVYVEADGTQRDGDPTSAWVTLRDGETTPLEVDLR